MMSTDIAKRIAGRLDEIATGASRSPHEPTFRAAADILRSQAEQIERLQRPAESAVPKWPWTGPENSDALVASLFGPPQR